MMIANLDRAIIVQFLIGLALTVGGWLFFVQPRLDELRQLETSIVESRARSSSLGTAASDQLAQRARLLRAQVAQIDRKNTIALDSALLYARITSLAKQHHVLLQSLQPSTVPTSSGETDVVVCRVDLTIRGGYEQVAAFIEALDGFGGYLRPSTLVITPAQVGGEPTVTVRLGCDALSFTLPPEIAQLKGGST
ncbi:MAG: hypothetical protein IIC46_04255 [Planctomycetes bacterium]|nr:hypothetical protein [Planctomycetota bacterium]